MSINGLSMESLNLLRSPIGFSMDRISFGGESERKRTRWLSKLEEIEAKLGESETINSELIQIKAELNRKIIELEKAQRPLIDENRKLQGRNKILQQEMKKLEQQLSHTKDDFFTMRDAHERVRKENCALKGKRANAEKLEQLNRYRQQIMEYSKCITALRSSGLEKDRRYELLINKYRRLRKCFRNGEFDNDTRSTNGSDCSIDDLINLNTINEDFEENALHSTSSDGQCSKMASREEEIIYMARIKELECQIEELKQEVAASRDQNELLEFQVLEMEETTKDSNSNESSFADTAIDSESYCSDNDTSSLQDDIDQLHQSATLSEEEKRIVRRIASHIEILKQKCKQLTSELEENARRNEASTCSSCETLRKETETKDEEYKIECDKFNSDIAALTRVVQETALNLENEKTNCSEYKKKLDFLTTEKEMNEKKMEKISNSMNELQSKIGQLQDKLTKLSAEKEEYILKNSSLTEENEKLREQIRPIKTDLERRYEETKYKLAEALEKIHDLESSSVANNDANEVHTELTEMKEYNKHLEEQIQAQTEMIDLLKNKVMEQKVLTDYITNICRSEDGEKLLSELVAYKKEMKDGNESKCLVDIIQSKFMLPA